MSLVPKFTVRLRRKVQRSRLGKKISNSMFVGIDLHKKFLQVATMDNDRSITKRF